MIARVHSSILRGIDAVGFPIDGKGKRQVVGLLGEPARLPEHVKITGWNEQRVVARRGRDAEDQRRDHE